MKKETNKIYLSNKKAFFDFTIEENFEAGIALTGEEIKALREKRVTINSSYIKVINGEVFWLGGNFNIVQGDKQRTKKLLLHKDQIKRLAGKTQEQGLTIIPLHLYIKRGRAKLEIGLAKGKKKYDKREVIKRRDLDREAERKVKQY